MSETGKDRHDHAKMVVHRIHGATQEVNWDNPDTQQGVIAAVGSMTLHELSAFGTYLDRLQNVITGELADRSIAANQQRWVLAPTKGEAQP